MADQTVRFAAIGCGRLGALHAENLAGAIPAATLSMVVDSDPAVARGVGERLGVTWASEPSEALGNPDIDAVAISTASDSHAALIVAAAAAGKAIFCEKPIALSLDDADRAITAVERAGVPLQIGFMRRYDPAYIEAKRLIASGQIGTPLTFRAASLDGSISPSREFLERCGGMMIDVALHDFDLARWLMDDEITEVYAAGAVLVLTVLREVGDVDNAVVTLRFARGGIGIVQVSHTAVHGYDIATEVIGTTGAVRAGEVRRTDLWRFSGDGRVRHDTVPGFLERFAVAYRQELAAFAVAVRDRQPPLPGGRAARAALAVALAARCSLDTGEAARVDEPSHQL